MIKSFFIILFVTVFVGIPLVSDAALINYPTSHLGLTGFWTFDGPDMVANVGDRSGQGNSGNLVNQTSTTTVIGKFGQALYLDGVDDYVSIPRTASLEPASLTISMWFNCRDVSVSNGLIIKPRSNAPWSAPFTSWMIRLNTSSVIEFGLSNASYSGTTATLGTAIEPNRWYHIAMTYDSPTRKGYLNSVEVLSNSLTGPIGYNTAQPVVIGADYGAAPTANNARCIIDDVRLYSRALSSTELGALYGGGVRNLANSSRYISNTNRLAGYWSFDGLDTISNITDRGGVNNGRLSFGSGGNTGTTTVSGKIGQAYGFDGIDDVVSITDPNLVEDISSMTVSAWVKSNQITNGGSTRGIVTQYQGANDPFGLLFFSDNRFAFEVNTGSAVRSDADAVLTDLNWHHYVGVYNGSNALLYIDGVLQADQPAQTGNILPTSNPVTIGAYDSGTFFPGSIDEVRIYSRALTAPEVKTLYEQGSTKIGVSSVGNSDGLVGWWTFDGKDMHSNVLDKSGQGNNANLMGQTSTTTAIGKIGQAIRLDGVDDYLNAGTSDTLSLTSDFTVAAWYNPTAITDIHAIAGRANADFHMATPPDNGYWLITRNESGTNVVYFEVAGDTATIYNPYAMPTFDLNKWHHIAGVRSGNSQILYIDGVVVDTQVGAVGDVSVSGQTFYIGRTFSNGEYEFSGSIDDVRAYNKALSPTEVRQLFNMGR